MRALSLLVAVCRQSRCAQEVKVSFNSFLFSNDYISLTHTISLSLSLTDCGEKDNTPREYLPPGQLVQEVADGEARYLPSPHSTPGLFALEVPPVLGRVLHVSATLSQVHPSSAPQACFIARVMSPQESACTHIQAQSP